MLPEPSGSSHRIASSKSASRATSMLSSAAARGTSRSIARSGWCRSAGAPSAGARAREPLGERGAHGARVPPVVRAAALLLREGLRLRGLLLREPLLDGRALGADRARALVARARDARAERAHELDVVDLAAPVGVEAAVEGLEVAVAHVDVEVAQHRAELAGAGRSCRRRGPGTPSGPAGRDREPPPSTSRTRCRPAVGFCSSRYSRASPRGCRRRRRRAARLPAAAARGGAPSAAPETPLAIAAPKRVELLEAHAAAPVRVDRLPELVEDVAAHAVQVELAQQRAQVRARHDLLAALLRPSAVRRAREPPERVRRVAVARRRELLAQRALELRGGPRRRLGPQLAVLQRVLPLRLADEHHPA